MALLTPWGASSPQICTGAAADFSPPLDLRRFSLISFEQYENGKKSKGKM
jgi:hypothetical protein